jgi:hypothetical protein
VSPVAAATPRPAELRRQAERDVAAGAGARAERAERVGAVVPHVHGVPTSSRGL